MIVHGIDSDDLMPRIVANLGSMELVRNSTDNLRVLLDNHGVCPAWGSLTPDQKREVAAAAMGCWKQRTHTGWKPGYDARPYVEQPDRRDQPRYIEPSASPRDRASRENTSPAQDNAIRFLEGD